MQVLPRDATSADGDPGGRAARRPRPAGPAGGAAGAWPTLPAVATRRGRSSPALARGAGRRRPLAAPTPRPPPPRRTTAASSRRSPRPRRPARPGRRRRSPIVAPGRRALRPGRPGRDGRRACSARSRSADPRSAEAIVGGPGRGLAEGQAADARRRRREGAGRPAAQALARGPRPARRAWRSRWGSEGVREVHRPRSPRRCSATARDETKPDAARVDAARQLVEFRPRDAADGPRRCWP